MEHSKEPWDYGEDDCIYQINGPRILNVKYAETSQADLRRIVACVNACRGLDTELLENIVMLGDTLLSRIEMLKDEGWNGHYKEQLLAAIVKFRKANLIAQSRIDSVEFWTNADESDVDEIDLEEILAKLELFAIADQAMTGGDCNGH